MLLTRIKNKSKNVLFERLVSASPTPDTVRIGTDYGGWWVPEGRLGPDSICYLAGLGEDASFDLGLIERFGCEVWSMDPTPRSITFAETITEPRFHFLPVGVWSSEDTLRFYAPQDPAHVSHSIVNAQHTASFFEAKVRPVRDIMADLGHDRLDLLKMNIEGAEVEVLKDIFEHGPLPSILCVAMEAPEPIWKTLAHVRAIEAKGYRALRAQGHTVTFARA